ncbi:MAG: cytochrome c-type biogenesis protein CcmH [Betaproteobacteria bacterium]|nr:cytochrome c-type biogenesis protein CcmH [Betaproteobacteria bacterium]
MSLLFALLLLPQIALAREAAPVAEDPALEARVTKIAEELRCLVCQNQNIADSHAELAIDLKNQVREMLKKGMSDKEIIDFMVSRYGDFVLYRPPVKGTTWLLWFGPFVLLAGGLGFLFMRLRRRQGQEVTISDADRATAEALLDGNYKEQQ